MVCPGKIRQSNCTGCSCKIIEFSVVSALDKLFDVCLPCFTETGDYGHFPPRQRTESKNRNTSVFINFPTGSLVSKIFLQLPSNHSGTKFNSKT